MNFVLDSNVFIEAYRRYYGLDLAPKFWSEIVSKNGTGHIVCIDRVQAELVSGNDALAEWIRDCACTFAETNDQQTVEAYTKLMQWANDELRYTADAKAEFASIADAWIVAYAKAYNCTVTTLEVSDLQCKRRVKIPDACNAFSVPYVDTFTMLRQLKIQFT